MLPVWWFFFNEWTDLEVGRLSDSRGLGGHRLDRMKNSSRNGSVRHSASSGRLVPLVRVHESFSITRRNSGPASRPATAASKARRLCTIVRESQCSTPGRSRWRVCGNLSRANQMIGARFGLIFDGRVNAQTKSSTSRTNCWGVEGPAQMAST
jgi:hypothetical protein